MFQTLSNVKMPVKKANWKKTTMGNQFVLPTWNESINNKLDQWTKYEIITVYLFVETNDFVLFCVCDKINYLK